MSDKQKIKIGMIFMWIMTSLIFIGAASLAVIGDWPGAFRGLGVGVVIAMLTLMVSQGSYSDE